MRYLYSFLQFWTLQYRESELAAVLVLVVITSALAARRPVLCATLCVLLAAHFIEILVASVFTHTDDYCLATLASLATTNHCTQTAQAPYIRALQRIAANIICMQALPLQPKPQSLENSRS
jgi:hypothetical protein